MSYVNVKERTGQSSSKFMAHHSVPSRRSSLIASAHIRAGMFKLCVGQQTRGDGFSIILFWHALNRSKSRVERHCHSAEGSLLACLNSASPILSTVASCRSPEIRPDVQKVMQSVTYSERWPNIEGFFRLRKSRRREISNF